MTPGARIQAAIEILDRVATGDPAEKVLTAWARRNRFAGSGDRAAIRDHVFDALRCRRSFAALGGGESGRALMIGALRASGTDPQIRFTGRGYDPAPLTAAEKAAGQAPSGPAALDIPDWLVPLFRADLGDDTDSICTLMKKRAPVFLRVNVGKSNRDQAQRQLLCDNIETRPHNLSKLSLQAVNNQRKIRNSRAYLSGLVELQDVASQALCEALPVSADMRVLDYCAGGGGKTLALAARVGARYFAHDADPARMKDLPIRAKRAGAKVRLLAAKTLRSEAPYDLVLCDVPCSGSGAWRRAPEGKWKLTPERLVQLETTQSRILAEAAELVAANGVLAYATCSLLTRENEARIAEFLAANPEWRLVADRRFSPLEGGDGFFLALLKRT